MDARLKQSTTFDDAAVRTVEAAYDSAWNAGDIESILRLLTDGVVIINPYGEMMTGRDAVKEFYVAIFHGDGKGSSHSSQIRSVHFVTSGVALVDAEAIISNFGPGQEPLRHSFTDVLVKTGDGWRIDHVRAYAFMHRPKT
jgi:uncharacterized protein (TIGR02246 family)